MLSIKKIRNRHLFVYSTGNSDEWYVRLWLGEPKSHGIVIGIVNKTKEEAEAQADRIAKYLQPLFSKDEH